ncbi:unnamed protein product [Durusdinium trenchii]|uniref:Uncharacterized protein n=1 Tax=Durusdinium trenchii TaxID=1381693 RepID=A0ABP0PA85_9DINO
MRTSAPYRPGHSNPTTIHIVPMIRPRNGEASSSRSASLRLASLHRGTGSSSGPWGEGAPRKRVPTEFKTVRLVPSASDTEKSKEMLEKAGLGKFFERTPVKARATYIDLKQISDEMRTHQGESGAWYILTKMDDGSIPFLLD